MKRNLSILLFLLCATTLFADTNRNPFGPWYRQDYEEKPWWIDGFLGWGIEPTYPGSDETEGEIFPFLRFSVKDKWNNRYAVYPIGVSGSFDITEDFNFFVAIEYEAGGDGESADFEGLDEIDDTLDGNFQLSYKWDSFYVYGSLQPDILGRGKGLVWFTGAGYDWQITDRVAFRQRLGLTGGDKTHMETEFNITAQESERTGLPEYNPKAGIKNIEYVVQFQYDFTEHFSFFTLIQLEQYLGEAADSPLVMSDLTAASVAGVFIRW
ncbi:MAG: MipA/OmpV family protein [Verrucomicrobiota bacterium]